MSDELIPPEKAVSSVRDQRMVRVPHGYEVVVDQEESHEQTHLWDFIQMIWMRRWLVLCVFLLCVVPTVLIMRQTRPELMYQATAKVRLGIESPDVSVDDENVRRDKGPSVDTQLEILRSRSLANAVLDSLFAQSSATSSSQSISAIYARSNEKEGFAPMVIRKAQTYFFKTQLWLVGGAPPARKPSDVVAARRQMMIDWFLMGLNVQPIVGTQIIQLSYTSPDPDLSARMLNIVCDKYQHYDYESKADSYAEARKWLTDKLAEMKVKLQKSEQNLTDFTKGSSGDFLALSDEQSYRQTLSTTQAKVAAKEDEYTQLKYDNDKLANGMSPDLLLASGDGAAVKAIQAQINQLEIEQTKTGQIYGPRMKELNSLSAPRKKLEDQLKTELRRVRNKVRLDFERVSKERERLRASLDEQETHAMDIQSSLSQYRLLKREVDINSQFFNNLLQKWKEIELTKGLNVSNVSILQAAAPPLGPLPNHRLRTVMMSIILGLFLGVGMVFFLNYMDTSFRSADEIYKIFRQPIMGVIPFCDFSRRQRREIRPELVTHLLPFSGYADCYRGLRTVTQYAVGNGKSRKIVVSSALPGEGKTTVATNLAVSFAQKGCRTLLIDADLKNPSLQKVFGVKNKSGLSTLLTDSLSDGTLEEIDHFPVISTEIANLDLLTSGPRVPNPIDLLESKAMRQLLLHTEEIYDYVVIDSAPLIDIADTSVLGPFVDGVIFVMRPGKTPRRLACEAKDKLTGIGARILGVAVNYPTKALQKRFNVGFGFRLYGNYAMRGFYWRQGQSTGAEQLARPADVIPRFLLPPGGRSSDRNRRMAETHDV